MIDVLAALEVIAAADSDAQPRDPEVRYRTVLSPTLPPWTQ